MFASFGAAIMLRFWRQREGATAVAFSLGAVPVLLFAGATLDWVTMINQRNDLQSAIDAAVLNGARSLNAQDKDWSKRAHDTFVSNAPFAASARRTFNATGPEVRGEATYTMPTAFGGLFGKAQTEISVSAAATMTVPQTGACILVLEPTNRGVLMNSGSRIESNCGLQVNSRSSEALFVNSGARVTTPSNKVVGSARINSGGQIEKAAEEKSPVVPDPMASLAAPAIGAPRPNVVVNSNQTVTLQPGTHGVVNVNSRGTLILAPGTHVFTTHLNIGSNSTIEGNGVTLFFANNGGKFQINSNATSKLRAPTSGPYKGVLFFQARNNQEQFIINTNAALEWFGLIYIPDGELLINSHANVADLTSDIAVITDQMIVNGGSRLNIKRTMPACGTSQWLPSGLSALCTGGGGGATGLRLIR